MSTVNEIAAAVSYDIRRTEVRTFKEPHLPPDGGLLRVELCGVCGSDWPYYLKYPKVTRRADPRTRGGRTCGQARRRGRSPFRRQGRRPRRARRISAVRPLPILPQRRLPALRRDRHAQPPAREPTHPLRLDADRGRAVALGRLQPVSVSASQRRLPPRARACAGQARLARAAARQRRRMDLSAGRREDRRSGRDPGAGPAGPRLHGRRQGGRRRRDHRQRAWASTRRGSRSPKSSAQPTPSMSRSRTCATPCATSPAATWPTW